MSFYFSWWKEKKHLGTGSLPFHHGPDQKGIVVSGLGVPLQLCGKQCMCVLALFFLRKQTVAQATGKCRRESLCGFGPTLVVGRNMWVWKLWQLSLHMRRIETVTWHKLKGRWSRCTNICPYLLWTATSWDAKSPLGWLWLDAPWLHQLVQVQVLCYLLPKCPQGKAPYQDLAFTWTSCLPQTKKGCRHCGNVTTAASYATVLGRGDSHSNMYHVDCMHLCLCTCFLAHQWKVLGAPDCVNFPFLPYWVHRD